MLDKIPVGRGRQSQCVHRGIANRVTLGTCMNEISFTASSRTQLHSHRQQRHGVQQHDVSHSHTRYHRRGGNVRSSLGRGSFTANSRTPTVNAPCDYLFFSIKKASYE